MLVSRVDSVSAVRMCDPVCLFGPGTPVCRLKVRGRVRGRVSYLLDAALRADGGERESLNAQARQAARDGVLASLDRSRQLRQRTLERMVGLTCWGKTSV